MKVPPMPVTPSSGLRCLRTRNLCGTDTWGADVECGCVHCQRWLGRRDGYAAGFAAALGMLETPSETLLKAVQKPISNTIGYGEDEVYTAIHVLRAAASALADIAEKEK